jgi:hypothetical protein
MSQFDLDFENWLRSFAFDEYGHEDEYHYREIQQTKKRKRKMGKAQLKLVPDKPIEVKKETEPTADPIRYADLPLISTLSKPLMKQARELLEELELHTYFTNDDGVLMKREDREKQIKAELETLQRGAKTQGLRFGGLCFVSRESSGRETLDKGLLLENGVTAEQIKDSIKRGKSYVTNTFKKIEV